MIGISTNEMNLTKSILLSALMAFACGAEGSVASQNGPVEPVSKSKPDEDALAGNASLSSSGNKQGKSAAKPPKGLLIIDHSSTDISKIPKQAIERAKEKLHIAYQHTSHGSQIVTGMDTLKDYPAYGDTYSWNGDGSGGALELKDYGIPGGSPDLSQGDSVDSKGDTPWVVATRKLLDSPQGKHINVVLWSWCSINGHDAKRYVDNMEKLIAEYPNVIFPFMTGHAEGGGEETAKGSVHYNNEYIRRRVRAKGRVLFDFADIEAHDPDGKYYFDKKMMDNLDYSGGNYAKEWMAANPSSDLAKLASRTKSCAHSDSPPQANLNCVQKGRAAWWMWARLAGWEG